MQEKELRRDRLPGLVRTTNAIPGPIPGVGDGLTPASGEGSGLAADSGAFVGFSVPGVVSGAGEVAGRITTRGVAEAPGDGSFSAGAAGEGSLFSSSWDRLL